MGINLELLRVFVDAAGARTFGEAAVARRVSVSAVSQGVKALEGQLGVPLFERVGRRVRLTPAGERFLAVARDGVAKLDEAARELADGTRAPRGPVRLGGPRTFSAFWVRPRLVALLRRFPALEVTLAFDVPSVLERRLLDGALDLAVLGRPSELPGVATEALTQETFVAVASPAWVKANGRPKTAEDFRAHGFAVFDRDLAMHAPWWRASFGAKAALPTRIVCTVASLDELQALAESGACVTVLPDYFVAPAVKAKRLVVLEPAPKQHPHQRAAKNTLFLAWRAGAPVTAAFEAARNALRG